MSTDGRCGWAKVRAGRCQLAAGHDGDHQYPDALASNLRSLLSEASRALESERPHNDSGPEGCEVCELRQRIGAALRTPATPTNPNIGQLIDNFGEAFHAVKVHAGAWECDRLGQAHNALVQAFVDRPAVETTKEPSVQAPIARLEIENDVVRATLYAPGLPDGSHDLYCEPPAPGGRKVPHPAFETPEQPRLASDVRCMHGQRLTQACSECDWLHKGSADGLRTLCLGPDGILTRTAEKTTEPPESPPFFDPTASEKTKAFNCAICEDDPKFPNIPCSRCGRYPDGTYHG